MPTTRTPADSLATTTMPLAYSRGVATLTPGSLATWAAIRSGFATRSSYLRLVLFSLYDLARTCRLPLCSRMLEASAPPISPWTTEAIKSNNASPMATARAEKNERRRLRPRSRKAMVRSWNISHLTTECLHEVQRLGRLVVSRLARRDDRGQGCNNGHGERPHWQLVQSPAWIKPAVDQRCVGGDARQGGEVHPNQPEQAVEGQPQPDAHHNARQAHHGAFQDEQERNLPWPQAQRAQQTDLAGALDDRH